MLIVMRSHGWQLGEHGEWAKHTDFGALQYGYCRNMDLQ
jgi:hypothetical protein